jgi:centromeric protein E
MAVLNLIDLAGSESLSPGATHTRQSECRHINKSLLGLRRVILKLAEGPAATAGVHIPYRETKLTRVLQSALGGNSHTALICTLCPTREYRDEGHNTLRFVPQRVVTPSRWCLRAIFFLFFLYPRESTCF